MNPSWYARYFMPPALDFVCGLPMVSRFKFNSSLRTSCMR